MQRKQADMSELTLVIGNKNYSSWSLRPWIAMKTFGIAFRETLIPFDFEGGNTEIKAVSASGKVPMLIDGDIKVWESLAILEYLAERFPEHNVWPADAASRAEARSVASEMATGFFALRGQCPFNLHRKPSPLPADAGRAADVARINAIWSSLLEKSGGPFLFGGFSAADAMFAPVVGRFRSYALTPSPIAARYMEAMTALPAWKEWEAAALAETWIVAASEI